LTLHNVDGKEKWAQFPGKKEKKRVLMSDFSKDAIKDWKMVERIIMDNNKRFTDQPLRLDIYSPDVVDLRLVDLPGLIHVCRSFFLPKVYPCCNFEC
jgi:hypothetical protein